MEEFAIASHDPVDRRPSGLADQAILRAKYLDWCSARLAERFLTLTPEEIYERAERAAHASRAAAAEVNGGVEDEPPSLRGIIERITAALTAELELPGFEEWAAAYRRDPSRYDEELLGLWRGST